MSSLLDKMKSLITVEVIDGSNVNDTSILVMLDVEFTPVLPYSVGEDPAASFNDSVPTPCRVQMEGARWCVWIPQSNEKYRWVTDDELKVMRARYLLLRGFYFRTIERMSHQHRQEVLSKFFPGGLFKPAILMGLDPLPV